MRPPGYAKDEWIICPECDGVTVPEGPGWCYVCGGEGGWPADADHLNDGQPDEQQEWHDYDPDC